MTDLTINCECKTCGCVTEHWILDVGVVKAAKCSHCGTQGPVLDVRGHEYFVLS